MNDSALKSGKRTIEVRNKDLNPGDYLFENGELGNELYIIERGKLQISQGRGAEKVNLAQLGPGAMVGEMALFDGAPRSADATALEPTSLKVITKASFSKMIQLLPIWLKAIINIVVSRIREANSRVDCHSIPKINFSLARFISLSQQDSQGGASTSFDYFNLQDSYCFYTRANRDDFKLAVQKLQEVELIDVIQEESGNKTLVVLNDSLLREVSKLYIDFRNKTPILAKDITQQSSLAMSLLGELFAQNPQQQSEISLPFIKFMERLKDKSPSITERALEPLLKFQIISKEGETLTAYKSKLSELKLSIIALNKLKGLLK